MLKLLGGLDLAIERTVVVAPNTMGAGHQTKSGLLLDVVVSSGLGGLCEDLHA